MSAALTALRTLMETGLSFIYPDVCQICSQQRATKSESYVCEQCRAAVKLVQPPCCDRCGLPFAGELTNTFECGNCREMELHFLHARAAVAAEGVAREVIHRYKYQRAMWFEPLLAELLISRAEPVIRQEKWDLIVPIPLHPLKQREREFNQAERLAKRLGEAVSLTVNARLIQRTLATRTQTLLTRQERAANMAGAFSMRTPDKLHGERVILVDDVLTTGATTSACARVLKQNGASEVCVWTVARGL